MLGQLIGGGLNALGVGDLANTLGGWAGNRGENEFRDVGRGNFNLPGYQRGMDQRQGIADQYGRGGAALRQQQQGLANVLGSQARGIGPSVSDMQMQRGLQATLAQQQAMAASGRGNAALGARQASMNAGNAGANITASAAQGRVQEQQQAASLLGGILQGARGQDINQQQNAMQQQLAMQEMQQRGMMGYEDQRGDRFRALTQTPTANESGIGMLSSVLGFGGA